MRSRLVLVARILDEGDGVTSVVHIRLSVRRAERDDAPVVYWSEGSDIRHPDALQGLRNREHALRRCYHDVHVPLERCRERSREYDHTG